jgi:2-hydroxy-3-oxopropionate reductase
MSDEPTIGFLGLGVMGLPMAANLQRAGFPLVVHSRTRERATALLEAGAAWAASPAELAGQVDVVITMVPDAPDVAAVVEGSDGVLAGARAGLTWIDMSSIAPEAARRLAGVAGQRGVACLDAPVSGGEAGAVGATLSIMVGGDEATFERCRPIFERLGTTIVRVGDTGAGQVAKVCNQIVVGCNLAAAAEALVLAAESGVDPAVVRQVLLGGLATSRVLEVHGQRMLDDAFTPGFRAVLHRKDMVNALDAGRTAGAPLPMAAVVTELLSALVANGEGDLDHSAVVRVYRTLAGAEP